MVIVHRMYLPVWSLYIEGIYQYGHCT